MTEVNAADIAGTYRRALRDARVRGLGLARGAFFRVLALIEAASRDIETQLAPFGDRPLTETDAFTLRVALDRILAVMVGRIADTVTTASDTTVDDVTETHSRTIVALLALAGLAVGSGLALALAGLAERVKRVVRVRRQAASVAQLLRGHLDEAGPALDRFLAAAAAREISTATVVNDLSLLLTRAVPVDLQPYGLEPADLIGYSSLSFDARRVTATEPLNALREANTQGLIASPIVRAAHWNVSARHAALPSSPDECDILARGDFYGLGPGMYPPDRWPGAPHPFCECVQGPPFLFWPAAEWEQDHPVPPMIVDLDRFDAARGVGIGMSPLRHVRMLKMLRVSLFDTAARRARGTQGQRAPVVDDAVILAQPSSAYPAVRPDEPTTLGQYTDSAGRVTPKRKELHDAIVREAFAGKTAVEAPTVYVMGGGPASGKSAMIEHLDVPSNVVRVDPDRIKEQLPEFREGIAAKDPGIAAAVHDESGLVAREITARSANGQYNFLIDGTGDSSYENLAGRVRVYRAGGGRVIANYVTVDVETAVARARTRGEQTGRFVPEAYIRTVHRSISEIMPRAIAEGLFDELNVWDNNGPRAKLIARAVGGHLTIYDQTAWERFLAKAGG